MDNRNRSHIQLIERYDRLHVCFRYNNYINNVCIDMYIYTIEEINEYTPDYFVP